MVFDLCGLSCRDAPHICRVRISAGQYQAVGISKLQCCHGLVDCILRRIIFKSYFQECITASRQVVHLCVIHIQCISFYHQGSGSIGGISVLDIDVSSKGTLAVDTIFLIGSTEGDDLISGGRVRGDLEDPVHLLAGAIFHASQLSAVVDVLCHEREGLQITSHYRRYGNIFQSTAFVDDGHAHDNSLTRAAGRRRDCGVLSACYIERSDIADNPGHISVLRHCQKYIQREGHILCDGSTIDTVLSPDGGIDFEVDGIDAFFCELGDGELVPYFRSAVVAHVIQMSHLAGINDVKGPGVLGGILGNVRLDRDIAKDVFFAGKIFPVHSQGQHHFYFLSRYCLR